MVEIIRKKNCFKDMHEYEYRFNFEDAEIVFKQMGSGDLYFLCYPCEHKNIELKVTKNDYLLYKVVERLYNNIVNAEFLKDTNPTFYKQELQQLYDGEKISWKSDAMVEFLFSLERQEKIYNYLNIYEKDNFYILEFINNSDTNNFTIEFNTDRSRYRKFVTAFWLFLQDLKEITEPYRQITIDEYLNSKKLINKME